MKQLFSPLLLTALLVSCGNDVEEIKDPSTGTILKRYEYYTDENGQKVKDGQYTEWHVNGELKLQENYSDGKREGESIVYHSKDSIYTNIYKDDQRNGACKLENSEGITLGIYNYKDNELDGETIYNYPNGKPYLKANYSENIPQGEWKYFDEKGNEVGKLNMDIGIPKELLGRWNIEGLRLASFAFDGEHGVSLWEPYNKYSSEPFEKKKGLYFTGRLLSLQFGSGAFAELIEFEIKSVSENKVILKSLVTQEDWVLTRYQK